MIHCAGIVDFNVSVNGCVPVCVVGMGIIAHCRINLGVLYPAPKVKVLVSIRVADFG